MESAFKAFAGSSTMVVDLQRYAVLNILKEGLEHQCKSPHITGNPISFLLTDMFLL
jgi:hypothetical protein